MPSVASGVTCVTSCILTGVTVVVMSVLLERSDWGLAAPNRASCRHCGNHHERHCVSQEQEGQDRNCCLPAPTVCLGRTSFALVMCTYCVLTKMSDSQSSIHAIMSLVRRAVTTWDGTFPWQTKQ